MLVGLGLAEVRLELAADLVEQLIQAAGAAVGGGHAPMARIHRHCCCWWWLVENPSTGVPLLQFFSGSFSIAAA